MNTQAVVAFEVFCVLLIAVGVWMIYWPASLIVCGVLMLVGSQGLSRTRVEDGD